MRKFKRLPSISSTLCLLFMFNSGSALAAEPVSFSASAGTPTNTHDNNLITRWGAQGVGEWIEYDLGRLFNVEALDIAFYRGDERSATIDIETSADGNNWNVVFSGDSASTTLAQQPFDVQDTEARYVRIVGFGNTINNWISLTEVDIVSSEISTEVVNDDPVNDIPTDGSVNLAQGRPVSQSSTNHGGAASRAVDGNTDAVWRNGSVTHTATENQPWWQVDLGSVSRISHINLHNRIDCCSDRLSDFHVLVSETPFTTNDLNSNLANNAVNSFYNGSTAGSPTRIDINANGRYVRVQLAGSNPLSLAEVEVFGGAPVNEDPVNDDPVNDDPVNDDSVIFDETYADIPDFSHVGYLTSGERDLPNYEMSRRTVSAVNGDDWANIRDAINEVASFTPDANGYRGVVYLPDAAYEVSQPIRISTSGIIVEGGGREFTTVTATWVQSTGAEQGVFHVEGTGSPVGVGAERRILETREPGDHLLNVGSGHDFNVGDSVWVISRPTENWTDLLGVTEIWGGSELPEMERRYKRTVVSTSASSIEIDAPLVDAIDNVLVPGSVQRYTWNGVVRYVGIRNLHVSSVFASATDENHAWTGVYFENAQDGFVDSVDGTHFVYATVYTDEDAYRITVIDSSYSLPRGQIRGSRRYAFTTRGQLMLFRRVFAQEARHSFTTNTGSAGPNAFVECVAEDDTHESGPYHRWNPGTLIDNCSSEYEIATQDRLAHTAPLRGWTGASIVFFNCEAPSIVMGTPPGLQNWAYGCVENSVDGVISTGGSTGTTTIESTGNRVQTAGGFNSLYDQQFHERGLLPLTKAGLTSITSSNGELVTSTGAGAFDRLLTLLLISITILRWRR